MINRVVTIINLRNGSTWFLKTNFYIESFAYRLAVREACLWKRDTSQTKSWFILNLSISLISLWLHMSLFCKIELSWYQHVWHDSSSIAFGVRTQPNGFNCTWKQNKVGCVGWKINKRGRVGFEPLNSYTPNYAIIRFRSWSSLRRIL